MPLTDEMVSIRGGMFNVRLRHGGSGEPLVYLHGGTGGSAGGGSLSTFADLLAERFEMFIPTHPGWGVSTGIEHIENSIDMALYYHDFFDQMGLTSAHVVGTSLGGMFAAEIAAINGSYVRKLVLAAPAGLLRKELPYLPPDTPPEVAARAAFMNPPAPPVMTPEEQAEAAKRRARATSSSGKFFSPDQDGGFEKRIHRIKAPTLLLWGAHDGLVNPQYGPVWQSLIPGSQLVIMPDAAHVPMLENRDEFVRIVTQFLAS
jgi:pimeloyl-ACP methyl ester carboxylesterase